MDKQAEQKEPTDEQAKEFALIRYCELVTRLGACKVGWGSANREGIKSCFDEPAHVNCRNLVKVPINNLDSKRAKYLREQGDVEVTKNEQ